MLEERREPEPAAYFEHKGNPVTTHHDAPDIPDAHRCRHIIRTPKGTTIECNDLGGWVHDEERKTWRPARPGERKRRCWLHGPGSVTKPVGRNRKIDKPNERMQRYAALVLGMAPEVTKALREVHEELSMLGFPSAGGSSGGNSSGDTDGPVARDAIRIADLTAWREDLRDWIGDLEDRIAVGMHIIRQIRKIPPAALGAKLCKDVQQNRQGSTEWGDPECTTLPDGADNERPCKACRERERAWRQANGLPSVEIPPA